MSNYEYSEMHRAIQNRFGNERQESTELNDKQQSHSMREAFNRGKVWIKPKKAQHGN